MSRCPNCHQPVGTTDDICENCGAVLASTASTSAVPIASPAATISSPAVVSVRTVTSPSPDPLASSAGSRSAATTCPNCRQAITLGEEFCEHCGIVLAVSTGFPPQAAISATVQTEFCPRCQEARRPGVKFCNRCGYRFVDNGSGVDNGAAAIGAISSSPNAATQAVALVPGSLLNNKYRISKTIGTGGMGAVYLAEDQVLKRQVVIKALLSDADPELVAQSVKEREFLASIKHASIVSIYDFITAGSQGYIVMEYVAGKTLDQIIEEQGKPFDIPTAINYMLGILPAFTYLAKLGLVYCDFKPQNVMLEVLKDGSQIVKLIDLGTVIQYTPHPDTVYGTHGFYAPEAVRSPSPETDLYTICRTLAYMVTQMDLGNPIFGMPPSEYYKAFRDYPVLYRFLCRGTHTKPAQRFHSAEELGDQLSGVLRQIAGGVEGVPVSSRLFVSGAMATTGKLGALAGTALDEKDKAIGLLRSGDSALRSSTTAALALYRQAALTNARSVDAHLRIAEILIERGEFTEALVEVTRAQIQTPKNWKLAWYMGRLLEAQGNLQAAAEQYRELLAELPGELPPLQALARVCARQGDDSAAVNLYTDVLKADPGNTEAILGITQSLLNLQRWQEAIQVLSNVSEAVARYVDARLMLCDVYLNRIVPLEVQNVERAAEALEALTGRTEDARYYLMRGEIYRAAWQLTRHRKMSRQVKLAGVADVEPRTLGLAAEESYQQYLRRVPHLVDRETIVRRKLEVAPWRLW